MCRVTIECELLGEDAELPISLYHLISEIVAALCETRRGDPFVQSFIIDKDISI